jgi:hypothetical protein
MSNQQPTKDMIEAPLHNYPDNDSQFLGKMQHLKHFLRLIELSYEGYLRSVNYADSKLPGNYREEGATNQKIHRIFYGEALEELTEIWRNMHSTAVMEGN